MLHIVESTVTAELHKPFEVQRDAARAISVLISMQKSVELAGLYSYYEFMVCWTKIETAKNSN